VFFNVGHVHTSLIFAGKAEQDFTLVDSYPCPQLGQKGVTMAKALAYYNTELITTVKSFILHGLGVNHVKPFLIGH
jgi:hypothetical protein